MRRPQGPQGEETAEEAPAETEDQGPPDHVAPSPRQPARHVRGQKGGGQLYLNFIQSQIFGLQFELKTILVCF